MRPSIEVVELVDDKREVVGHEIVIPFLDWEVSVTVYQSEDEESDIGIYAGIHEITDKFFAYDGGVPSSINASGANLYQIMDMLRLAYKQGKDITKEDNTDG